MLFSWLITMRVVQRTNAWINSSNLIVHVVSYLSYVANPHCGDYIVQQQKEMAIQPTRLAEKKIIASPTTSTEHNWFLSLSKLPTTSIKPPSVKRTCCTSTESNNAGLLEKKAEAMTMGVKKGWGDAWWIWDFFLLSLAGFSPRRQGTNGRPKACLTIV